jgi:type I restriction-modification system DNA methylase subunit
MKTNFSQTAAYIWSLADLLRGDFKQSQYGRVILPFTILRRLECVLEGNKPKVLAQVEKLKAMKNLEEDAREKFLLKAAKQSFYNTSPIPVHAEADALHVATATVHAMDYLLTWNCRHIDNAATKPIVRSICAVAGYTCPEICTPLELLSEEIEDVQR